MILVENSDTVDVLVFRVGRDAYIDPGIPFPVNRPGCFPINLHSHIGAAQVRQGENVRKGDDVLTRAICLKALKLGGEGGLRYRKFGFHSNRDAGNFIIATVIPFPSLL